MLCAGLTLSCRLQDVVHCISGGSLVNILQDLIHSRRVWTTGEHHPLFTFGADVHVDEETAPPVASPIIHTTQHFKHKIRGLIFFSPKLKYASWK